MAPVDYQALVSGAPDAVGTHPIKNWPERAQFLGRVFEHDGFTVSRKSGDHLIYTKIGVKRPLVIPTYKSVPVFIIKNLLRTSGMSRERYFELLGAS